MMCICGKVWGNRQAPMQQLQIPLISGGFQWRNDLSMPTKLRCNYVPSALRDNGVFPLKDSRCI